MEEVGSRIWHFDQGTMTDFKDAYDEYSAALVPWKREALHKSRSAAPGSQGATTAHIGDMQGRSNAASRDGSRPGMM
jgi:hypothetical protein